MGSEPLVSTAWCMFKRPAADPRSAYDGRRMEIDLFVTPGLGVNSYLLTSGDEGALELREAVGAEIVGPARARYEFPHRPVAEADEVEIGDASLVALEAPGHTFEHTAYVLRPPGV